MQLFRMKIQKNGKTYVDYILAWTYKGQIKHNRINPCFGNCYKSVHSRAILIDSMAQLKQYDIGE